MGARRSPIAPDDADSRLALAQVKGSRSFNVSHYRDFRHVMERERAALGCFVTLEPAPARPRADAKTAGRVHVAGQPYDRLHLWSMADYFERPLAYAAGHDRSVFGPPAQSASGCFERRRITPPGEERSMTSAFAASGIAGTTYKKLFRRQIMHVRNRRVVGMAVAYVSASGLSLVKRILDEGGVRDGQACH